MLRWYLASWDFRLSYRGLIREFKTISSSIYVLTKNDAPFYWDKKHQCSKILERLFYSGENIKKIRNKDRETVS